MARVKRGPLPMGPAAGEPFASAQAAWFWAVAGWAARLAGGRPQPEPGAVARACEPGDVIRCFLDLQRRGRLRAAEARALAQRGREQLPPPAHAPDAPAWTAGLAVLGHALRAKGLVR